jgi:hypothetical protein
VEIRHPTFDSIKIANTRDNVAGAEWLPLFPGYYFLMMTNILRFLSGNHISNQTVVSRWVAGEISHSKAANRLRIMAQEYEARALELAGARERLFGKDDGLVDNLANVQK